MIRSMLILTLLCAPVSLRAATDEGTFPDAQKNMVQRTYQVLLHGDLAYLGSTVGVVVVSVKDPTRPQYVGALLLPHTVHDLALVDGKLVAADGPGGVLVADISSPTRPRLLGKIRLSGAAMAVDGAGKTVVVASGTAGVQLVDITTPSRPRKLSRLDTPGYVRDVLVRGELVFFADGAEGLGVARLDHHKLHLAGQVPTGGHAYDLHLMDSTLLVGAGPAGLATFDLAKPTQPRRVGALAVQDTARGVAASGNRVAIAEGTAGLTTVDLSRPEAPHLIGRFKPVSSVNRVVLRGDLAFVANDHGGLLILRCPPRGNPTFVGALPALRR